MYYGVAKACLLDLLLGEYKLLRLRYMGKLSQVLEGIDWAS